MSTLYLAGEPLPLATKLADLLDEQARPDDPFAPTHVVVPNRTLEKWLQLFLARRQGIAINLHFGFLEKSLWEMLRAVDPRTDVAAPELLNGDLYRLLVFAVLLEESNPALANLRGYFRGLEETAGRRSWRRAWHLADMLGNCIRDYEYHRQDRLIQPWLKGELVLGEAFAEVERAQQAVFRHIIDEVHGRRALLNKEAGRNFKTLPQYAMEVLEIVGPSPPARVPKAKPGGLVPGCTIHLFGLAQISALHLSTLHWLGRFFDLRFYHHNPLVPRLPKAPSARAIAQLAQEFREPAVTEPPLAGAALLGSWARAGAESLALIGRLCTPFQKTQFQVEVVLTKEPQNTPPRLPRGKAKSSQDTVLARLQHHLLGQRVPATKLSQDRSLQIVGCPGALREVETVYHSIIYNLQHDDTLKVTDIAVLVTDMTKYRPILQAVFDRPPRHIAYNLLDYSAAGTSTFGQAVLSILDLALEAFTRTRVFEVLLNPCFLARSGVDRSQALTWLRWAKELGIYQGWDGQDKKERGYPASARYGWRLGLQRLRLGRFMEIPPENSGRPTPRFGEVLPFADMESHDREQLDAFSCAVEGLLPTLVQLRGKQASGQAWATTLRQLMNGFLDVPEDRPEEAQVRNRLLSALEQLSSWDRLADAPLPLALIREFVQANLESIEGHHGDALAGGITIAALAKMRPVPFRVLYVVGLGEELFPGSDFLTSFDLRGERRYPGDVRPAESARFLFLEALLSAQEKVVLLYNNRDIQKDRELLPAVPVAQLQRFLNDEVLTGPFDVAHMPLHEHDLRTLTAARPGHHDVGIYGNETERLVAYAQAQANGTLVLDLLQAQELKERLRPQQPDFALPQTGAESAQVPALTITELGKFLENPGLASLKRHLYLRDEEKEDTPWDDEPFVCPSLLAARLTKQVLHGFVFDAVEGSLKDAQAGWFKRFDRLYEDEGLRCRLPESGFGAADQAFLRNELRERIALLVDFLDQHDQRDFCGPVLLGASSTPIGARRRFPALTLPLPRSLPLGQVCQMRLSGSFPLVWATGKSLDLLVVNNKAKPKENVLHTSLFEPVLFYLALLANADSAPGECSSQAWLQAAECRVHIACSESLESHTYQCTAEEARAYLTQLAADFLDPTSFDLLPFDVLAADKEFWDSFALPDEKLGALSANYCQRFEEKIAEAREGWAVYWDTPLLNLANPGVPADAFAKLRRRFELLDRALAAKRGS